MIGRDEIMIYARQRGVDPFFIENDYLQNIALICIYEEFSNELVFKGGTALQKIYGLTRLSRDLDFNLIKGDPHKKFERVVKRMCNYYISSIASVKNVKHGIGYKLHIEGPSFNATGIKHLLPITFNTEEKLSMEPVFKSVNPSMIYKDPDLYTYSLLIMNIEEMIAEKMRALLTRKKVKPRDLYDIWFLLNSGFNINMKLVCKKMEYDHASFSIENLQKRIDGIKNTWESDLRAITKNIPKYDAAKTAVLEEVAMRLNNQ